MDSRIRAYTALASTVGAARATVCDGLLLLVLLVQQP